MITLKKPIQIKIQQTVDITSVSVSRYVDLPKEKIVRAFVDEINSPIVLWEKNEYDLIGDWTEEQAEQRLIEILSK
jgi:hypothetical protein